MVACPTGTYDEVEPILKNFGKTFYTGEKAGLAQTAKLANNLLAAAAHGRLVGSGGDGRQGRPRSEDPDRHHQRRQRPQQRNAGQVSARGADSQSFDFGFATGLSYKDVRLCVDEAEALGVPMVVGAAVRQMLAVTQAKFGADSDFTSIARVVEEWAGVEIKG